MEAPRFQCDAMLGALARWLRLAGFDTAFSAAVDDAELAATARRDERWLLTRDRSLAARAGPRVLCIQATEVPEQLREVCARLRLRLDPARFFTRCSRCNGALEATDRRQVAALVPPYVAAHADSFSRCRDCGQVYWPGTHHERILERLREVG
ncbi:MAG TPA: Mut7-C RNAse domain-containing protein [Thermoanaerobaculaceae bacterium]|nr:Mut7-C RNAse domain-containing protein [Thermoanaerobaculaceae bacterium]HRS16872.1 Mut7-C RNAse domain-containing protein [Thermoanaerobaculaceae bacterium]